MQSDLRLMARAMPEELAKIISRTISKAMREWSIRWIASSIFTLLMPLSSHAQVFTAQPQGSEGQAVQAGVEMIATLVAYGVGGSADPNAVSKDEIRFDGLDPGTVVTLTDETGKVVCQRAMDSNGGGACQRLTRGTYKLRAIPRGKRAPITIGKSSPYKPGEFADGAPTSSSHGNDAIEVSTGTWLHLSVRNTAELVKPPLPKTESNAKEPK